MKNIKIIFFDIDGTLIDMNKKQISEKMIETLVRLKERRMILCLATGRGPMGVPHFDGVEFDAFLTFNGSYCFNKQETIFTNPISAKDVKKLVRNSSDINRPVSVATKERLLANGKDEDLIQYYAFSKTELVVSDDFEEVIENETIYQLMLGCRKSDYPDLLKGVDNAKIAAWWHRAADIIPANGGKGIGIKKMLEYYHLDREEALAFGDGNNDIEMFQAVGHGVAMENASDKLKAIADDICGHVANDGIYHYCIEHELI